MIAAMRPCIRLAVASLALAAAAPAAAQDFWKHWGDGRAELNGYRLTQPRYGVNRDGSAVLVFVTEDFSDSLRVKADPGKHPAADVYPVMKLNVIRSFQTGIYDYNTMTSVFARVAAGWPLVKVSFSSQEWCGHVWHQIVPGKGGVAGLFHSYFDGEADGKDALPLPEGGVFEDALAHPAARLERRVSEGGGEPDGAVPGQPLRQPLGPRAAGLAPGHDLARGRHDARCRCPRVRSRRSSRPWPRRAERR